MFLNRIDFINKLSIRRKVNFTIAIIFALIITILTTYNIQREKSKLMEQMNKQAEDITTMYFDSLNTMMLTGTMDQRHLISQKMLVREGVVEARVLRGKPVVDQYGPGLSDSTATDDLDRRALSGENIAEIVEKNGSRVLTVISPFKATDNTRGVNCLKCHDVKSGDINGAVRIAYSLDTLDNLIRHELWMSIGGSIVFFIIGLALVNMLLKTWIIEPLNSLTDVVSKRAKGDLDARVPVNSDDELGVLALSFNEMSDIMDDAATKENERIEHEHIEARKMKEKVDDLLIVVKKVAEGDYTAKVSFTGEDSIGELAGQLQQMIDYIRMASEEKLEAIDFLQCRSEEHTSELQSH